MNRHLHKVQRRYQFQEWDTDLVLSRIEPKPENVILHILTIFNVNTITILFLLQKVIQQQKRKQKRRKTFFLTSGFTLLRNYFSHTIYNLTLPTLDLFVLNKMNKMYRIEFKISLNRHVYLFRRLLFHLYVSSQKRSFRNRLKLS